MRTPIDFGKEFLQAFFNKRQAKEALTFLADDVVWLTPDEILHLKSEKSALSFLEKEIEKDPRQFNVDIAAIRSAPASDDTCTIVFDTNLIPKHTEESVDLRCSLTIHREGIGYSIVFVGLSRRFTRTSDEHIKNFIDNLPSGVMVFASLAPGNVKELFCNSYIEKVVGEDHAAFIDHVEKNPFFMLPYEEQRFMHTMMSELSSLAKPKPICARVNIRRSSGDSVAFQAILTAAYKEDSRTIIYVLFNEITDILREVERVHKKDIAEVASQEQEKASREKEELVQKAQEEKEELERKASREKEKLKREAGIALDRAQADAEELVEEALDKADELMRRLRDEAQLSIRKAHEDAADRMNKARSEAEAELEKMRDETAEALRKAQDAVQKAQEEAAASQARALEAERKALLDTAKARQDLEEAHSAMEAERAALEQSTQEQIHEAQEKLRREMDNAVLERDEALKAKEEEVRTLQEKYAALEDGYRRNDMQYQERILKLEWQVKDVSDHQEEELKNLREALEKDYEERREKADKELEEKLADESRKNEEGMKALKAQLDEKQAAFKGEREALLVRIERIQAKLREEELGSRRISTEAALRAKEQIKTITRMRYLMTGQLRSIENTAKTAYAGRDIPEQQKALETVAKTAGRLPEMVKDIGSITGIDLSLRTRDEAAFRMSECVDTVRKVIWPQCRENGIIFSCATEGKVPDRVIGAKPGLLLAMVSILENAVHSTAAGGRISLVVSADPPVRGKVYYHFVITDNGSGIPEDRLPSLFDDPESELSLARKLIGNMGGSIQVRSNAGKGSRFEISANLKLDPDAARQ